jgi:hypothetical protein
MLLMGRVAVAWISEAGAVTVKVADAPVLLGARKKPPMYISAGTEQNEKLSRRLLAVGLLVVIATGPLPKEPTGTLTLTRFTVGLFPGVPPLRSGPPLKVAVPTARYSARGAGLNVNT